MTYEFAGSKVILVIHGGSFMPAYCAKFSPFDIYVQWCIDTHRAPPTRAEWDNYCNQPRQPDRRLSDDGFDDAEEQRDGWSRP